MLAHPRVDGGAQPRGIFRRIQAREREAELTDGFGDLAGVEPPPPGRDRMPRNLELLSQK